MIDSERERVASLRESLSETAITLTLPTASAWSSGPPGGGSKNLKSKLNSDMAAVAGFEPSAKGYQTDRVDFKVMNDFNP